METRATILRLAAETSRRCLFAFLFMLVFHGFGHLVGLNEFDLAEASYRGLLLATVVLICDIVITLLVLPFQKR